MPGKGKSKDSSGNPPGWSKGKKTGWQDTDIPPGQSRKAGSHVDSAVPPVTTSTQSTEQEPNTSDQSQADANTTF